MKRYVSIFLVIFMAFGVALLVFVHQYRRDFTPAKWAEDPDERRLMVDDLMQSYDLIGMSESEVTEILGAESPQGVNQTSFKGDYNFYSPEDSLVYYIGRDGLEGLWLILCLDNGRVSGITYGVT